MDEEGSMTLPVTGGDNLTENYVGTHFADYDYYVVLSHFKGHSMAGFIHGEKAHSCYFSRDAFAAMVEDNPYADNKELLIIPGAVHTDLYDQLDVIPFDRMEVFFTENLK